jgi:hypothetical protein
MFCRLSGNRAEWKPLFITLLSYEEFKFISSFIFSSIYRLEQLRKLKFKLNVIKNLFQYSSMIGRCQSIDLLNSLFTCTTQ